MHVFRLYLFDVLVLVVSYAASLGVVLTPVLLFVALTGVRHFDQWAYDAVTAMMVTVMWNLGRLYEHYRMGGFG
jgi:hypothetical protein